jgi:penicillin-binding protein-related factor A (putative recombinase)
MLEKDLRLFVKKNWCGFIDWLEPTGNAGVGRPDCDILVDGVIAPIELKIGNSINNNIFSIDKMRSDQISWQHRFYKFGGVSFFMIAENKNNIYLARKILSSDNKNYNFDVSEKIGINNFSENLKSTVRCWRVF